MHLLQQEFKTKPSKQKRPMIQARLSLLVLASTLLLAAVSSAQDSSEGSKLQFNKWSGKLNVPDPVSITVDENGRAFVTQTQRRKSQDLDIREHRGWIPDDLSFQSVEDKRKFYRQVLSPLKNNGLGEYNSKHVDDHNKDGSYDYRDLMVLSENIHQVEDKDQDGVADKVSLWAEGFHSEVTGIAAGVLAFNGDVYATVAPDVWRLSDTNGDGKADKREVIATGFGIHIAYAGHDMHGLTLGPDGRIYWTIGDKGISSTSKEGKRFHYPNQGGVMRCDPDGSNFEVFAHGLRNVQELAFDQYGNLFGFDNDSDQPRERERFVYIAKGMDAGWRCNYQYRGGDYNPWVKERMWEPYSDQTAPNQPRYIVPAIANSVNGPCGFAFNPGRTLSPQYDDHFFLTSTLGGEQLSFKIEPLGDSFELKNEHQIGKGIAMIGINFGPSGLFGVDWAGGYPLNQKGHIWKIDVPEMNQSSGLRTTQSKVASDLRQDFSKLSLDELAGYLESVDQRVRLKSQFEIVKQKGTDTLVGILKSHKACLPRIHAIWGLGQLARRGDEKAASEIHGFIKDQVLKSILSATARPENLTSGERFENEQVLIAAIRAYGELPNVSEFLPTALVHPSDHVKQQAALALTHSESTKAFPALIKLAEQVEPHQAYIRHAVTMGMAQLEYDSIKHILKQDSSARIESKRLEQLSNHENETVRLFAVVAIRKLTSLLNNDNQQLETNLGRFLNDSNEDVATESARAIHDDFSITSAIPTLAAQLNETKVTREAFLIRALNANYRLGDSESLARVVQFAKANLGSELGSFALDAIKNWKQPQPLDRVTGRFRGRLPDRIVEKSLIQSELIQALKNSIEKSATGQSNAKKGTERPEVELIATLTALEIPIPKSELLKIYNSRLPPEIRAGSLSGLAKQTSDLSKNPLVKKAIESSLLSKSSLIRIAGLEIAVERDPGLALKHIGNVLEAGSKYPIKEQQLAITKLGAIKTPDAITTLADKLKKVSDPRLALELLQAGNAHSSDPKIASMVADINKNREKMAKSILGLKEQSKIDSQLKDFFECANGGDPQRGKAIFNTNIDAQCVRCHRTGKKGSDVGPELSKVASREPAASDPNYLLRSIVDPSAEISDKYQSTMFLLESGETVKGVITREDKKVVVIVDESGKEVVINIDEIEDESKQKVSIMPLAKSLTKRDIRDLVAYLKTLKKKNKKK